MTIDPLENLIERCHQRRTKRLRQQKTVPTPAMLSKGFPHQYRVYCAHRYPVLLDDLEQADISFMPIGRAPDYDRGPRHFGGHKFLNRQGMKSWSIRRWDASWGIQIYTGIPSERDGARWHDFDFKYEAISAAPDAVFACVEALVSSVVNPILTMSMSGGLRFSCRIPDYLHTDAEEERFFIYKYTPTPENPYHRDIYLEIFGDKGYSRWDGRYELLCGNLLDPPVIAKEVLFAHIDALRVELHEPVPDDIIAQQTATNTLPSLGSQNLDLAKEAFLQRGFTYLRQENGFHYWTRQGGYVNNTEILLWESEGTVWIRTSTPDAGLPMEATPITDIWCETGIIPPTLTSTPLISDRMLAVREGKLSPLAIRRPKPMLHQKQTQVDDDSTQGQHVFDSDARILGLTISDTTIGTRAIESYIRNDGAICLNDPDTVVSKEIDQHFENPNQPSLAHWKDRMHLWNQVKGIPIDERMANPFAHGNVCEDPERCEALEEKGGDPSVSICPKCPVYTTCQERGYLSQPAAAQRAKIQILESPEMFFDPQHAKMTEEILKTENRLCIINKVKAYDLFPICRLPRNVIEEWIVNWRGEVLGNFANALLNALEITGKSHGDAVKRIRTVMRAFEWHETELIEQMCQINVRGRVVERSYIDDETDEELARFTIEFAGGVSAYIPLNDNALNTLKTKGLPFFPLYDFTLNEDIKIPMSMTQAIQLGILDTETVQNIQAFPTVWPDPTWTFWHQLKRFFAYYTRDADAPIRWLKHERLRFTVPPVLHPNVKRLALMSATPSGRHLRRAFPNDDVEVRRTEPTPWLTDNQVFQIRTGLYPHTAILDYGKAWDTVSFSKIGQRFFIGMRAEIEREPNVKHLIIAGWLILNKLQQTLETENVCFQTYAGEIVGANTDIEDAEVIWIVGLPERPMGVIWERSQVLFGNDEEPLCYDKETNPYHYTDEPVQSVYEEAMVRVVTEFVELAQLTRQTGRKVMLLTGLPLPDITDRPETLLFDWEDFEIAGGLDRLPETIATRQRYETERANLTAESGRDKVQQVLGCSAVHANRILNDLRGGNIPRTPFRDQIRALLADGEKKAAELVAAIEGNPTSVRNELTRLVDIGEIVKVRRGVYALSPND